jgi:hypothetical protein
VDLNHHLDLYLKETTQYLLPVNPLQYPQLEAVVGNHTQALQLKVTQADLVAEAVGETLHLL